MEGNSFYNKDDNNQFILTNKTFIEKQNAPSREEEEKNDLKFLYQITSQNLTLSNIKKDIGIFLELTDYIFNDIKVIFMVGKNVKNMEYNSKQKINNESLYNNKVKCFNNNLNLFQKKLLFIKEKNNEFKEVYKYIKKLKNYGFLLDEKFDINENDMILDLEQIIIHHKWVQNFEKLINIENKNFKLIKDENGQYKQYKLKSDFYNYYNNKYKLSFNLEIKIYNNQSIIFISNEIFEDIIKEKLLTNFEDNQKELLLFYIKYLLYKFLKEEAYIIHKYQKNNEIKEEEFINKGLTFNLKKNPNNIHLKCNYYDNMEINYFISKIEKDKYKIINNWFFNYPYMNKVIHFKDFKEYFDNHGNKKNINNIISYIIIFVKLLFDNLLFDIKFSKNITNFIGEVKRNNNITLDNIIKYSIFIRNITKIGLILLKKHINNYLNYNNISFMNHISLYDTPIGKYKIIYEYFERGMKIYYIIELLFDFNLNLTIKIKEPYKNMIFSLDQGQIIYVEKGRINFSYLNDILITCVSNFTIINSKNKYFLRNSVV